MSLADRILDLIQGEPGMTDRQLRERLGVKHLASVNQSCRRLAGQGKLRRIPGPLGTLVNVPQGIPPAGGAGTAVPPGLVVPPASPKALAPDPWPSLANLALARTLLVIPCSARKATGGACQAGTRFGSCVPAELAQQLSDAQTAVAGKARLDASTLLPAWRRYEGGFYEAALGALEAATIQQAHVLILSGGYGVVLATQPIGTYHAVLKPSWWPKHLLQQCLLAYARTHGLTAMIAFAGASTTYAKIVRTAHWRDAVDLAFLLSPRLAGKGGAMSLVPKALGEAFAALWSGTLDTSWASAKGVSISVELLV